MAIRSDEELREIARRAREGRASSSELFDLDRARRRSDSLGRELRKGK